MTQGFSLALTGFFLLVATTLVSEWAKHKKIGGERSVRVNEAVRDWSVGVFLMIPLGIAAHTMTVGS